MVKTQGKENLLGKRKQAFRSIAFLALLCVGAIGMVGCTDPYGTAAKLAQDVATIDNAGATTVNSLYTSGTITAAEETEALGWVGSIATLNETYIACVTAAHGADNRAAGYLGCAQTFAAALESPTFLSAIQIKNANSQATVEAIGAAAASAANAVVIAEQNLAAKGS